MSARLVPLALLLLLAPPAAAADEPKVHKDLAYGKHARQKLDLSVPKADKPLPLVVWVHGGGWEAGDKSGGNPAKPLLEDGYAVASINYRFSKTHPFPAQLHDCQAAVRYLKTHAKEHNIDPERVGVWGASAGGHLVALLGTTAGVKELDGDPDNKVSPRVQAVVDWFGPTDLLALSPERAPDNPVTRLLGGTTGDKKSLAKQANPAEFATKDDAPTLIFHGTKDTLVPLSQSEILHEALRKADVPTQLVVLEGAGHGGKEFVAQITAKANAGKTKAFFAKHLKK